MASEALELALALYRVPGQRHALRGMELPKDIGLLIQLASAPQPLLQETAAEVGETESTVLDASRFYLQQALFQPDADAYRMLGLSPDAAPERIREHYRGLQRWLHPDRRGEDWEALLATRVNGAWGHLRNEAARNAYDRERELEDPEVPDPTLPLEPRPFGDWRAIPVAHERGNLMKRIALGATFCGCAALLYLAVTREDVVLQEDSGPRTSAEAVAATTVAVAPLPGSSPAEPAAIAFPAPAPSEQAAPAQPIADLPVQTTDSLQPAVPPVVDLSTRSETPVPAPQAMAAQTTDGNVSSEIDKTETSQARASVEGMRPVDADAARTLPGKESESASMPLSKPVVATAPRPENPIRVAQNVAPAKPAALVQPSIPAAASLRAQTASAHPQSAAESLRPPSRVAARTQGLAASQQTEAHAENRKAESTASPATQAAPVSEAVAAAPLHREDSTQTTSAEPDKATATETLVRATLARARVQELSAFFGDTGKSSPPVWNDVGGQANAERQRSALHTRAKLRDADFAVDDPVWRLSESTASLSADYHLRRGRTVSESGRLSLGMVWREKMWLVTSVELQPSQ